MSNQYQKQKQKWKEAGRDEIKEEIRGVIEHLKKCRVEEDSPEHNGWRECTD